MGRAAIPAKREPTSAIDSGLFQKLDSLPSAVRPNRNETAFFQTGLSIFSIVRFAKPRKTTLRHHCWLPAFPEFP